MSSISAPFIKRPVATTLLTIAIVLAGGMAYTLLPVAPLPQIDFPTIFVSAGLPGGSPEVMAASVATPLEKQFTRIAGVTEMTSSSSVGSATVVLQFDLNRDINAAARDVQAAINAAAGNLPANLPTNPRYRKMNPADAPIHHSLDDLRHRAEAELYDIASSIFAQKLSQVKGVGSGQRGRQLASRGARRSESRSRSRSITSAWIKSALSCRAPMPTSRRAKSRTIRWPGGCRPPTSSSRPRTTRI